MKPLLSIVSLAAVLGMTGCGVFSEINDERYSRNNAKGREWLSDQSMPAETNIGGNWHSGDWGYASFSQDGRRITGNLGNYAIKGVVSGNKAYLVASEDGWDYYSIILERDGEYSLKGRYSRSIPYQKWNRGDFRLERR